MIDNTQAPLSISPRVERLRERLERDFAAMPHGRRLVCPREQECYARLAQHAYAKTVGQPEILRKARFLEHFAEQFPAVIRDDERIVGSLRFTGPDWRRVLSSEAVEAAAIRGNRGHIIVDYGRVVRQGLPALCEAVASMPDSNNRRAFAATLNAFATFIRRHDRAELTERPARTFREALQMTWFIQIFLRAEGNASAVSFGRLDQFLWPFLKQDLAAGSCTEADALELIECFFIKCCEGGESQNLTVGGNGEENPLSVLLLRAMRAVRVWQPSLSVRIGSATSEDFWREALLLCDAGIGMPAFFNDSVVTEALRKLDLPADRAADWGIVGCYEASPQGDTFPWTVAGGIALPDVLRDWLQTGPQPADFDACVRDFKQFFSAVYRDRILPEFEQRRLELKQNAVSPFESLCVTGCIESGRAAEEGGARFSLFGVNILGIGTLVDSLLAIRRLVFDESQITLPELTRQVAADFPDGALLARCRALPGKFGSDAPGGNRLAADLSQHMAACVLASRLGDGFRPYPGFFWFGQDIHRRTAATPDGRRAGERVSYGCGPGVLLETSSVTSMLNAAAAVDHTSCACGNPLTLSFDRSELNGHGPALLRRVIETYFGKGGFHLHINIVAAEELRRAQAEPERYRDLTVRISGFSARFVTLDDAWQDAIIERTARSM